MTPILDNKIPKMSAKQVSLLERTIGLSAKSVSNTKFVQAAIEQPALVFAAVEAVVARSLKRNKYDAASWFVEMKTNPLAVASLLFREIARTTDEDWDKDDCRRLANALLHEDARELPMWLSVLWREFVTALTSPAALDEESLQAVRDQIDPPRC